jgi:hypothetical protein
MNLPLLFFLAVVMAVATAMIAYSLTAIFL